MKSPVRYIFQVLCNSNYSVVHGVYSSLSASRDRELNKTKLSAEYVQCNFGGGILAGDWP
jgi:hypothetical protein